MKRTRTILAFLMLLSALQLVAACAGLRGLHGDTPADDAKRGAAFGGAIGGPEGAVIGTLVSVAFGVVARWQEKRHLRRKGVLIDKPAKRAPDQSDDIPTQQSIGA